MAVIPTTGYITTGILQIFIQLFKFGIIPGISQRSNDTIKFLGSEHQFQPISSPFSDGSNRFVTHRHIVGTFIGQSNRIGQGYGIMIVSLVKTFQCNPGSRSRTILNSQYIMIGSDISGLIPFIHQNSPGVCKTQRRIGRQLIIPADIAI